GMASIKREIWAAPTDEATMVKRARGRGRYNRWRQFCATERRLRLGRLLNTYPPGVRPPQRELAKALDCSISTVCRDLKVLQRLVPLAFPVDLPAGEGFADGVNADAAGTE